MGQQTKYDRGGDTKCTLEQRIFVQITCSKMQVKAETFLYKIVKKIFW